MPSLTATPAQLAISGGSASFEPTRFEAVRARLTITAGEGAFAVGSTALTVTAPKLDRLNRSDMIATPQGMTGTRFQIIWQQTMEAIEQAFEALTQQVGDNTTLLQQIQAAQALAQAANDNAAAVNSRTALADSYTDPVRILTAANDGSVSVIAHDRVYGDGTVASVDAGSVTGFASGDYVAVYYEDAGREGGGVSYLGSTSPVSQEGSTHVVGQVTIPAAGEAPATGSGTTAPGYTPPPGDGPYDSQYGGERAL